MGDLDKPYWYDKNHVHHSFDEKLPKEVIIMVGCIGSGKTTYCNNELSDYYRISQDDMGIGCRSKYLQALKEGKEKIVVDRQNFSVKQREFYVKNALEHDYLVKAIELKTPMEVCASRAKARPNHPTLKPEKVDDVISMYNGKYETPTLSEGFCLIEKRVTT